MLCLPRYLPDTGAGVTAVARALERGAGAAGATTSTNGAGRGYWNTTSRVLVARLRTKGVLPSPATLTVCTQFLEEPILSPWKNGDHLD